MTFFDVTQSRRGSHHSGLRRVNVRLRHEMPEAIEVHWDSKSAAWKKNAGGAVEFSRQDWLLTTEVFSPAERPGFAEWLGRRPARTAAIFHDAIPLRFPAITWPQSVERHPYYLKMLTEFDRVWSVSETSRDDLRGWWNWLGVATPPPVDLLALGADAIPGFLRTAQDRAGPTLVCLGILEPRKNQQFLLEVARKLWDEGVVFDLWLFGRVNPYFGRPVVRAIRDHQRVYPKIHYEDDADDGRVREIIATAAATVFPTMAEGCGLPVLESLWNGVPCVCSDLPVLRENAEQGGCLLLPLNSVDAWVVGLRRLLSDGAFRARLRAEAAQRELPTWKNAAQILRSALGEKN